jgi:hypothetical protein
MMVRRVLVLLALAACQSSEAPIVDAGIDASFDAYIDGGACEPGEHVDNEDCTGFSPPACCEGTTCHNYWCSDGVVYHATSPWDCLGAECPDEIQYACVFTREGAEELAQCANGCGTDEELHCDLGYANGTDAGPCDPIELCAE